MDSLPQQPARRIPSWRQRSTELPAELPAPPDYRAVYHPIDHDLLDDGGSDADEAQSASRGQVRRLIVLAVILLVLASLLLYDLQPVLDAFFNPPPPPSFDVPGDRL